MLSVFIAISLIGGIHLQTITPTSALELRYRLQPVKDHHGDRQREGERIWEQAIAAKGGRERLYAVRNLVISTEKDVAGMNQVRREELIVLPNKYWFWDDYRPNILGVRVSMYNFDTNMKYVISDGEPNHPPEPITDKERGKALRNVQLSCLLETKWLKPIIVKASTGRVGLRPVDIVQTTVDGERVDFAFDRKTHLLLRVSYYDVFKGKTYINIQSFSDYIEVRGMKVPQTIVYDNDSRYTARFDFNVDYNEDIFIKPPPIEAGPEVWKVGKR